MLSSVAAGIPDLAQEPKKSGRGGPLLTNNNPFLTKTLRRGAQTALCPVRGHRLARVVLSARHRN